MLAAKTLRMSLFYLKIAIFVTKIVKNKANVLRSLVFSAECLNDVAVAQ